MDDKMVDPIFGTTRILIRGLRHISKFKGKGLTFTSLPFLHRKLVTLFFQKKTYFVSIIELKN